MILHEEKQDKKSICCMSNNLKFQERQIYAHLQRGSGDQCLPGEGGRVQREDFFFFFFNDQIHFLDWPARKQGPFLYSHKEIILLTQMSKETDSPQTLQKGSLLTLHVSPVGPIHTSFVTTRTEESKPVLLKLLRLL